MIRLFAALSLPPDIIAGLERRQTGVDAARWRPPESLHLTLRFFGDLREDVAHDLDGELGQISSEPFSLELSGVGAFGEGRDIHAIWAGVAENPALTRLARACETAARRAGLRAETRNFRPHVTLAYLRHADPVEIAQWVQANNLLRSPPIGVDRFALFSSHQSKEGSFYRHEAEYRL